MHHHLMRSGPLLFLAAVLAPSTAEAQLAPRLTVGATFAGLHSSASMNGSRTVENGSTFGGTVQLGIGKIAVVLDYAEGSVHPTGNSADRGFVEGGGGASLRVTEWLSLGGSVRIHRVDETAPERWVTWGAGAGVELPIIGPMVRGHAAVEQGVEGEVNLPAGGVRARRGEVGASWMLPRSPLSLDLTARLEQYDAGSERRTLQHLALTLNWHTRE